MSSRTATIKAVVLGDADDFKRSMSEVGESAEEAGTKVKRDLGESFDKLGEGAGGAEQKFIGLADTIGGTQDVMEGLRTGNVQTLATGLADLAGATEALWSSFGKVITQTWAKITATGADTAATATNTTATIGQRIATAAATVAAKAQAALPRRLALKGSQGGTRRQQGNAVVAGGQQQLPGQIRWHAALVQEQVIATVFQRIRVIAEIAGHGTVGVQVDHDHTLARLGQQAG